VLGIGYPYWANRIGCSMKTTLDIPDPLLREARTVAARERTTLRALVEQGLRRLPSVA
jgi:hypothetical protein